MESIAFALTAFQAIQALLQAGGDALALVASARAALAAQQAEGRDPTKAERDALDGLIKIEMDKLLA